MPLHFVCPHCGSPTIVEDQFLGQTGPCFTCGKTITVPYAATSGPLRTSAGSSGATATATLAAPPAATNRGSSVAVLVVVIAGGLVGGVGMLILLISLLAPAVTAARNATQVSACGNNLVRIGQALQLYHQTHGTYPPAITTDATGKPMHSWRVLILPYCGESNLYQQYDFTQPWDSPQNLRMARRMPEIFACPADPDAKSNRETSYMVVYGPGTAFPGLNQTTSMQDLTDGSSNTALVFETSTKAVSWTKPEDLDATRLSFLVNDGSKNGLGSGHEGGMHVLTADGNQHFIHDTAPKEFVEALTTIKANDSVLWEVLED